MTDKELKELVASLAVFQKETELQQRDTDKQIKELGKQIGKLGNSMGNIAEGLAYPSIEHELRAKFKAEVVSQNVKRWKGNENFEIDILAYSNSKNNEVYIVEIKTTINKDTIEQIKKILLKFRNYFPEHNDKKLYGIICGLKYDEKDVLEIYDNGLYFADVNTGLFTIHTPKNFHPKEF
ncbi:MAG: hypothetical protein HW421_1396 [Ignavibacteria bacterium]|nr:hypothetical protein [Ignavibacteria bacterium]